jgi:hypothetical protein
VVTNLHTPRVTYIHDELPTSGTGEVGKREQPLRRGHNLSVVGGANLDEILAQPRMPRRRVRDPRLQNMLGSRATSKSLTQGIAQGRVGVLHRCARCAGHSGSATCG